MDIMKKYLQILLGFLAKKVIQKYSPDIIAITGSVGKSSTKQAIFAVLSARFAVRVTQKNYNTEWGVPATILGVEPPGSSFVGWIRVIVAAARLLLTRVAYPRIVILEMGADRPGDIAYLMNIALPKIGVLTWLGDAHYEFFKSREAVLREKVQIIKKLPHNGCAILNTDNEQIHTIATETKIPVTTFGFNENASVRASSYTVLYEENSRRPRGILFTATHENECEEIRMFHVLGRAHVYAALAGIAVGIQYGETLHECVDALGGYEPMPGRMGLFEGIKNTVVIDDTYNASPSSMEVALNELNNLMREENGERYAVLGDMRELGAKTESAHQEIGKKVAHSNIDVLVCVGEMSRDIARGARQAGMEEHRILHFAFPEQAGDYLKQQLEPGDIVLFKASRGVKLEKAVAMIRYNF